MFSFYLNEKRIKMAKFYEIKRRMWRKKKKNLGVLFLNSKWNLLFDIYDIIFKRIHPSLMRVFLNHIKIQFKEGNPLIYSIDIYEKITITYVNLYYYFLKKKKKKKLYYLIYFDIYNLDP